MRCIWCEGPREALVVCDAPRAAGLFCSDHATRGLIRRRIAAGLDPHRVEPSLWPLEERPDARQRAAWATQRQEQRTARLVHRHQGDAERRALTLTQHLANARAAGAVTARQIADSLNAAGVLNARGEPWTFVSVAAVLHRMRARQGAAPQRQPEAALAA